MRQNTQNFTHFFKQILLYIAIHKTVPLYVNTYYHLKEPANLMIHKNKTINKSNYNNQISVIP